ncbi:DNA dC-_dU-editing enzyme APOBEC-3F-like [Fukomys damarensis]|nr:DNA dC->dU-editing enzyme APOBEC-3F-like [Fukomys damarensis]
MDQEMEPSGCSGRYSLELLCPKGCRWTEDYREPMRKLHKRTFKFHFENLPNPDGWHKTFLCYTIESKQKNRFLRNGVFQNQDHPYTRLHAELRFLSWFHDNWLCPGNSYRVTFYMSWSPCSECAEELTTFLAGHRNVTLTIFFSKLYYCDPDSSNREGLKTLAAGGARLFVMFDTDFSYCWTNFVNCGYNYFEPWPLLDDNSKYCNRILQKILQEPMRKLHKETFYFHFNNLCFAKGRNKTFLCYTIESKKKNRFLRNGVFQNQDHPYTRLHAELRFLSWFHDNWLCPGNSYQVTLYMSWSPCSECAEELTTFLAGHRNVTLTIFFSKLYCCDPDSPHREGLKTLAAGGARLFVMFDTDFSYCWTNFVNCGYNYFEPWPLLDDNSKYYKSILQKILQ